MTVPARVRAVVTSLAACLLLAACSSTEAAQPADTTAPTVIVTPPTSDTTTTATVATTSSTVSPLDDDAAVRAVHTRFMTELFRRDERVDGPEVILPLAEELTTGAQLQRMKEDVARDVESGERVVSAGYDSHIVDVLIDGDAASVLDCSKDQGELYSADGKLIGVAPDEYSTRETRLVRIDGVWLVEDFVVGGGELCDPAA